VEAAKLEGVSRKAIQKRRKSNLYKHTREVDGVRGGSSGKIWQVHLSCLSPPAQVRYIKNHPELGLGTTCSWAQPAPSGNGNGNGNGPARQINQRELALLDFQRAPEHDKALARIRREILRAFEAATCKDFHSSNDPRLNQSEFCAAYNRQAVYSLPTDIYLHVPKVSLATLLRWRETYQRFGLGGLVRQGRSVGHEVKALTEDQQRLVLKMIHDNPTIRPVRVWEYLGGRHRGAPVPGVPHLTTVYRFMKHWKAENEQVYEYLKDPDGWRGKYQIALGDKAEAVVRFCQRWEADSTPADIICSDGRRYAGIGLIDIFSRLPRVVITETSKATGIAAVMRRGMMDWGIPEEFVKDHGQDYDSAHIEAVCSALEIATPWIPVETPEAKPFIERFWRTLATGLFEELPGFCGHNVAERQGIRNREKARDRFVAGFMKHGGTVTVPVSRDELQEVIDRWVKFDYAQRPHNGLGGKIPAAMPAISTEPVRRVSDERALDILLAPAIERTIQKKWIALERGKYVSGEMGSHIGKKVLIRPDLTDASRIEVFDQENRWLFTATDKTRAGLTLEGIIQARKNQSRAVKTAVRALDDLKTHLGNPMLERLSELEKMGEKITPIIRSEEHDVPAVAEAKRAVADRYKTMEVLTDEELQAGVDALCKLMREDVALDTPAEEPAARDPEPDPTPETTPELKVYRGRKPVFRYALDHYRWCLDRLAEGWLLPDTDAAFVTDFEAGLDEDTLRYWDTERRLKGISRTKDGAAVGAATSGS